MFKTTKPHITAYHADLKDYDRLSLKHEGTVKIAFQHLLKSVAKQQKWVLTQENTLKRGPKKNIRLDGVLFDTANLPRGYWEAKDVKDDLPKEVQKKIYKDR